MLSAAPFVHAADTSDENLQKIRGHWFFESKRLLEVKNMGLCSRGFDYLSQKPSGSESLEHHVVVYLIYEEIKKYTDDAMRYPVRNPDIVFYKGKKYAIEVETGTNLKNKEKLREKLKQLYEYPYWFFVVTKARLKKSTSSLDLLLQRGK